MHRCHDCSSTSTCTIASFASYESIRHHHFCDLLRHRGAYNDDGNRRFITQPVIGFLHDIDRAFDSDSSNTLGGRQSDEDARLMGSAKHHCRSLVAQSQHRLGHHRVIDFFLVPMAVDRRSHVEPE